MTWTFGHRELTVLGTQGFAEYAKDQHGSLWYRFTKDPADKYESWKPVANAYRICR